jgi:VWFA-related protein
VKHKPLQALILISLLAASTSAQQPSPSPQPKPPSPPPTVVPQRPTVDEDVVRITTNLVQVDAVVTDKSGKAITDLRPEEIRIFEDGRAQTVTNFSYVIADSSNSSSPPRPAAVTDKTAPPVPSVALRPEQVRRTMALVVDDLGLSFQSTYYVRRALKKFVDEQMQPGDLVAIIRTSGGIGALQQFTADKRQLYAAIDRVKWGANGRGGISAFAPIEPPTAGAAGAAMDAANEDLNRFREDVFAVGTLGAVSYVVRGLRELPGRKSILLISDGFTIYSRDDPTRNYRALESLRRLIDQALRASVVIYTMNATGLQTLMLTAADSTGERSASEIEQQLTNRRNTAFDSQEGLSYLAQETGGLAIRNTNDLSGGIKRVIEDQKGYYLIGYRPEESTFDARTGRRTFHKLNLKVLRPGKFKVRMRNGFYGVSDEEARATLATPREQIQAALFSPFGSAGVHVRLTALFANDAKVGSMARAMLHVSASDLTFTDEADGWHRATFDVVAVTFGDNGTIIDQTGRTHGLRVRGASYQSVLKDGFVYFITVPLKKAGAYQLRAALRDHGSERVGSANQFIEVPDIKKNRLVLSGIVLTARDPGTNKKQSAGTTGADEAAASPPGEDENLADATNSAAVRRFHNGGIMSYGAVIYNAKLDKASGRPQLQIQVRIFRDGQPVFTGKEQLFKLENPPDLKRLGVSGALQLGNEMTPGEYVFQVVVTDLLADQKHRVATQWIDFEVVK